MRIVRSIVFLAGAVVSSFALAMPDRPADRTLARATAHLEKGRGLLDQTPRQETNAARLQRLDRVLYFLRQSRTLVAGGSGGASHAVRADASRELVRALDDQAEIYLRRQSLPLASKRVEEALAIDSRDSRALKLAEAIASANATDSYSRGNGGIAGRRVRERRLAAGVTLRDRGRGLRR